ncbi:MAG TPA: SRPBCC domain-containing protein [Acidimicrobiia bacterium]|nr:SRPBCC domain-containing protein [Acidimicrobiia bacterium]
MTVTSVETDRQALTLTLTAHYRASIDRVWQLWADPRLLERWWGPPTFPATFTEHDLRPGGSAHYYMTGPNGDTSRGWWRVIAVDPPHRLELEDGFSDEAGNPNLALPTMAMRVKISEEGDQVRMTIETSFPSVEAMEQVIAMGMEEGLREAVGQIDSLLEEQTASRKDNP